VLMPADADAAIGAIVAAVDSGRLSLEQLEASLERRRAALQRTAAIAAAAPTSVAAPLGELSEGPAAADRRLAIELVGRSIERSGAGILPVSAGVNLIRLDSCLGCAFLPAASPALELPSAAGYRTLLLEGRSPSPWSGDPDHPLELSRLGEGPVLLQLFVRGNPFRGNAGGGEEPWMAALRQLQAADRLAGLAVYGSPYLWQSLRPLLERDIPAAYCPGQMPLAQSALLRCLGLHAGHGTEGFTD
jgi:beta-glucosidase